MAEYIEKAAALDALQSEVITKNMRAYKRVQAIQAADVAPVRHGRWISWEEAGNFIPSPDRYECSLCHDAAQRIFNGEDLLSPYCPNCGAKMDGEAEENG